MAMGMGVGAGADVDVVLGIVGALVLVLSSILSSLGFASSGFKTNSDDSGAEGDGKEVVAGVLATGLLSAALSPFPWNRKLNLVDKANLIHLPWV